MNSATFRARTGRILLATAIAVPMIGTVSVPRDAAASSPPSNYACFVNDVDRALVIGKVLSACAAAYGVFTIHNWDRVAATLFVLNQYLSRLAAGGPYAAYERQGELRNSRDRAAHLARTWIDPETGRGLPAGAPTRTVGEAIDGWLDPLREYDVNTWFNTSWSSPRDEFRLTRYDSDIWNLTFGADMPLLDGALLFGVFGSYTHSDVDTTFNNGDVESKLGTIGPYFAYTLNEHISFDTTVAGVFGEHDNVIGGPTPGLLNIRGDQETEGFFVSMNANANYWVGNWGVQGRVGFLHSDMENDSYNIGPNIGAGPIRVPGNNNELTQVQTAAQINYFYDRGLPRLEGVKAMPFFRTTFNYDLDHENIQLPFGPQAENDDDEVVLSWGVTLFGNGPISGSFEAARTFGRADYESWQVSGTVAYAF
jgi:outer membrane autotransporter protein